MHLQHIKRAAAYAQSLTRACRTTKNTFNEKS